MADNEDLPGVSISITADYSAAQEQFTQLQAAAATAGANVAAALTAGAAGADTMDDALERLYEQGMSTSEALEAYASGVTTTTQAATDSATQLSLFGDALDGIPWADATGQLNLFTDELEPFSAGATTAAVAATQMAAGETAAGEAAETASVSVGDLIQQLVAVKAALAVTQGMVDFGSAALDASDSFKQAQISLTALTGSATGAQAEISQLVGLAEQDGLSMPNLLTAAVRMQALVGAAAPVPAILQQLANAGAVSGQGIEAAANAFDRMATSGSAAARTLLPLGINLDDLVKSFNTLTGTTEATTTNINTLFKSLSETERVQVLTDALTKLNGIGQQVANDTFGGQWNQLVAEWNTTLKSAGDALLPVISDLVSFTKTDIVPFVKSLIDAFNSLPGPVKDTAVAIGIATAALVPLAGLVTSTLIAFKGFTALTELAAVMKGFAVATTETAEAEGAAAITTTGLTASSAALLIPIVAIVAELGYLVKAWSDLHQAQQLATQSQTDASNGIAALSAKLHQLGVDTSSLDAAMASGAITQMAYVNGLVELAAHVDTATDSSAKQAAQINLTNDALKLTIETEGTATATYQTANSALQAITASIASGLPVYKDHVATLQDQWAQLTKVNSAASSIPAALASVTLALANDTMASQKASLQYQAAAGAYQALLSAFAQGNATQAAVTSAFDKMTAAENAAAAAGAPIPGTYAAINLAAAAAVNSLTDLATAHQLAAAQAAAQTDRLTDLSAQALVADQKLVLLEAAQTKLAAAVTAGTAQQGQLNDMMAKVAAAAADAQAKTFAYQSAVLAAGNAAAGAAGEVGLMQQAQAEANLALDQAKAKFDLGTISVSAYVTAQKAAVTALVNLAVATAENNAGLGKSTDAASTAAVAYAGAAAKLAVLTQAYKDNKAAVSDVVSAQNSALKALIDLNVAQAEQNTGLQGNTTDWGLAQIAMAAAQATYDTLLQAYASDITLAPQVAAAKQALITAQNNLATASNNAAGGVNAATAANANYVAGAPAMVQAMGNISAAAANQVQQFANVGTAIDSVISDFSSLFTSSKDQSGGPAGGFSLSGESAGQLYETSNLSNLLFQQNEGIKFWAAEHAQGVGELTSPTTPQAGALLDTNQPTGTTFNGVTVPGAGGNTNAPGLTTSSQGEDGGVYPDVTAHQSAGEVWNVAISSQASSTSGGSSAGSPDTLASAAAATAASVTADTVASATDTMTAIAGTLVDLTAAVSQTATQVASLTKGIGGSPTQIATNIQTLGGVQQSGNGETVASSTEGQSTGTAPPSSGVGGSPTNVTVGADGGYYPTASQSAQQTQQAQAAAAAAGVPWDGSVPWDGRVGNTSPGPQIATVTPQQAQASPAGSGGAAGMTIGSLSVQVTTAASDPKAVANAVTGAITTTLIQQLRTNGARF